MTPPGTHPQGVLHCSPGIKKYLRNALEIACLCNFKTKQLNANLFCLCGFANNYTSCDRTKWCQICMVVLYMEVVVVKCLTIIIYSFCNLTDMFIQHIHNK